eukprot:m.165969 g.165969  ORF g.165969 m.165969 type:complete len:98 (+) comp38907_c0_seq3:3-296(+)
MDSRLQNLRLTTEDVPCANLRLFLNGTPQKQQNRAAEATAGLEPCYAKRVRFELLARPTGLYSTSLSQIFQVKPGLSSPAFLPSLFALYFYFSTSLG